MGGGKLCFNVHQVSPDNTITRVHRHLPSHHPENWDNLRGSACRKGPLPALKMQCQAIREAILDRQRPSTVTSRYLQHLQIFSLSHVLRPTSLRLSGRTSSQTSCSLMARPYSPSWRLRKTILSTHNYRCNRSYNHKVCSNVT